MDDKAFVVCRSYLLHHNELYKAVFIAPDRAKLEQEKLVVELEERRSEGEENFIIRNMDG